METCKDGHFLVLPLRIFSIPKSIPYSTEVFYVKRGRFSFKVIKVSYDKLNLPKQLGLLVPRRLRIAKQPAWLQIFGALVL
jgi:hypothetical protein